MNKTYKVFYDYGYSLGLIFRNIGQAMMEPEKEILHHNHLHLSDAEKEEEEIKYAISRAGLKDIKVIREGTRVSIKSEFYGNVSIKTTTEDRKATKEDWKEFYK